MQNDNSKNVHKFDLLLCKREQSNTKIAFAMVSRSPGPTSQIKFVISNIPYVGPLDIGTHVVKREKGR